MSSLPPDIQDLILRYFDSAEAIELVVLLRRSSATYWTAEAVSQHLGIRPEVAKRKMEALAEARILVRAEQTAAYRYAPADDHLAANVSELAEIYSDRRISVINTIYSANLERLRTFSNAFKLKKD